MHAAKFFWGLYEQIVYRSFFLPHITLHLDSMLILLVLFYFFFVDAISFSKSTLFSIHLLSFFFSFRVPFFKLFFAYVHFLPFFSLYCLFRCSLFFCLLFFSFVVDLFSSVTLFFWNFILLAFSSNKMNLFNESDSLILQQIISSAFQVFMLFRSMSSKTT